jgi:predicted Zn-dependent protease
VVRIQKKVLGLVLLLAACVTSPLGRQTLRLYPESEVDQMGEAAFAQMKREMPLAQSPAQEGYVTCITRELAAALDSQNAPRSWEVKVFSDESANAFALPAGKIGVHTGMFAVAQTPAQLAAVLGHEISHVTAEHTNERLSTQAVTETGLSAMQALMGEGGGAAQNGVLAALGLGAQVGVLLPFGRAQEEEADLLGLRLMARAGFDPRESVALWKRMQQNAGGGKPPEFLSTHPSETTRIQALESHMPEAMALYEQAVRGGRSPRCTPPAR